MSVNVFAGPDHEHADPVRCGGGGSGRGYTDGSHLCSQGQALLHHGLARNVLI